MTTVAPLSFTDLSRQARPYPSYLLPQKGDALALFGAGFHGWNDVVHFARQGLITDVVDVDGDKLMEMAIIYPPGIITHEVDAWDYAEGAAAIGQQWDVVSVDPFLGDAAERAWDSLYLWCSLARQMLTLTVTPRARTFNLLDGWTSSFFPRSANAAWMVLRRD